MRFTVNTKELNEAVATVVKALPSHSSMPVLEGIYISVFDQKMFMKCSDLSLQIETEIPAFVEEEGGAVMPGSLFSALSRKLSGESVEISGEKKSVRVKSGYVNTSLQVNPIEDYPDMLKVEDEFSAEISCGKLKSMIRQTIFAISLEDSKPILNGVCLEFGEDGYLNMVALDGFRLAIRREKVENCTGSRKVVVPGRVMNEISNILSNGDEKIKLVFSRTHIKIDFGYTRLIARLMDGEYVPYAGILPKQFASHAIVNCAELQASTERASLLSNEAKSNHIKYSFDEDMLTVSAVSEKGNIKDQLPIKLLGKPIDIAFNGRYILNVTHVLEDETVYIRMNNAVTPCVIEPMEGNSYYYMILPVRMFQGA